MRTIVSVQALRSRNYGLDLLRAAAICLVLISHFSLVFVGLFDPNPVVQIAGFLGVELFFVLSGFLIGQILLRTVLVSPFLSTVKVFWSRRWLRTLPAYYVVITILLVLSAAGLWAPTFDQRFLSFYVASQPPSTNMPRATWRLEVRELLLHNEPQQAACANARGPSGRLVKFAHRTEL
jgi:peptidoglycan/LPS O-acetylase OafA/YrhL